MSHRVYSRLSVFLGATAVAAAAILASAGAFAAQDPNINATVTAQPSDVTLRRALSTTTGTEELTTYASYLVTFANNTTNALNRVKFGGTTTLTDGTTSTPIAIDSLVPPTGTDPMCSFTGNELSCGGYDPAYPVLQPVQLSPGATTSFIVVVKAPTAGQNIQFNWTFSGDEGKSLTGNGCCSQTGTATANLVDSLSTTGKTQTKSFVNYGGTFFTGAKQVAVDLDKISTTVVIPPQEFVTTAWIVENENQGGSSCKGTLHCVTSELTIPHPAGVLFKEFTVILRRDATTLLNSAKATDLSVTYTPDPINGVEQAAKALKLCTDTPPVVVPTAGNPCISYRLIYPKKPSFGEFAGDAEIGIRLVENGKFEY